MRYTTRVGRLIASAALTLLHVGTLAAQGDTNGWLEGAVRDAEGKPVVAAQVRISTAGRSALTDHEGGFLIRMLPSGRHEIEVSAMGFAPLRRPVQVEGDRNTMTLVLQRTPISLPGVQVTATPAGTDALRLTQAASELSGAEMERSRAGSVARTLDREPGIAVRYAGPGASAPVVRGLSGDRVLVLQDGQRTADLAGSAVDHTVTIDPWAARRIEVVRGPAALLYGNNALGGVVNVISEDIPLQVPEGMEGSVAIQSESAFPGANGHAGMRVPLRDRWVVALRGAGRHAGDVRIAPDPVLGTRLSNTESTSTDASLGVGYVGPRLSGGAALKRYAFEYGLPVPPGSDPLLLRGAREQGSGRLALRLGSALFPRARLEASAQRYAHDELDPEGVVQLGFGLRTYTANVLLEQGAIGPFAEGAWGASALYREYLSTGPAGLTPPAEASSVGGFVYQQAELAPTVTLQMGGRVDRYALASEDHPKFGPGRRRVFDALSGSVGLGVGLAPGASVGISGSRSFRAPTVEELFSSAPHAGTGSVELGSPTLAAERNQGVDVVLRVQRTDLSLQLAAYWSRVADYVHPAFQGDTVLYGDTLPVFRYAQEDADLRGMEGSVEWSPAERIAVEVVGDWVHAERTGGNPIPFLPAPRLGGALRWDDGRWSVGGGLRHAFARDRVSAGDETPSDAYTLVEMDAALRVVVGDLVHTLTLRGENLTNRAYRDAASRIKDFAPNPGRNVSLAYRILF